MYAWLIPGKVHGRKYKAGHQEMDDNKGQGLLKRKLVWARLNGNRTGHEFTAFQSHCNLVKGEVAL